MITQAQGREATEYVGQLLQASGLYERLRADHQHVRVKEQEGIDPKTIDVVVANKAGRFLEYNKRNRMEGIHTAAILYADGKTAFAPIKRNGKARSEQALKGYTDQQIKQMRHLRDAEFELLDKYFTSDEVLSYYFPAGGKNPSAVKIVKFHSVHADYSHIPPEREYPHRHATNGTLKRYKLPEIIDTITGAAKFHFRQVNEQKRARIIKAEMAVPEPPMNERGQYILF